MAPRTRLRRILLAATLIATASACTTIVIQQAPETSVDAGGAESAGADSTEVGSRPATPSSGEADSGKDEADGARDVLVDQSLVDGTETDGADVVFDATAETGVDVRSEASSAAPTACIGTKSR